VEGWVVADDMAAEQEGVEVVEQDEAVAMRPEGAAGPY
jgi:hypothetical protein